MAAEEAGRKVQVVTRLCSEAFQTLKAGNPEKHNELLLGEIRKMSSSVDAIVLAQLSMSVLEPLLTNTRVPVYNSGRTAFARIRMMLELPPVAEKSRR